MSHRKETEAMGAEHPIEDWAQIPWRKLERKVYRLQKSIYQASLRGNDKAVHTLQRLLMRITSSPNAGSPQGNTGEPGQANRRRRWSQIRQTSTSTSTGSPPASPPKDQTPTNQTSLDTQTRKGGEKAVRHPDMGCTLPFLPGDVRDSICRPPGGPDHPIHHASITVPYIDENFKCTSASTAS